MTNKKRAVAYIRVSSASEAQIHSFEFQENYWREAIAAMPDYTLTAIFADKGISGKFTQNRKQFLAMIAAARRREFDTIFIKSVSRFARCAEDTMGLVKELREIGVNIIFETENIDTKNTASEVYLTVAAAIAEDAVRTNADNQRWSARKRFEDGKVTLGHGMLGYRMTNGVIEIVESEAEIVRYIFKRYASGVGKQGIANELMAMGAINYSGNTDWRAGTIHNMLKNERYCGCALLQKTVSKDGKSVKNDGSVTQYFVENSHPCIITPDEFWQVQEIMEGRKKFNFKFLEADEYAFRGKITCGHCGKGFNHKINSAGTQYAKAMWGCRTYLTSGRKYCQAPPIFNSVLETVFFEAYDEFVATLEKFLPSVSANAQKNEILEAERKLALLQVKRLITAEEYKQEHGELMARLKLIDEEIKRQALSDTAGKTAKPQIKYSASLVEFLESAVITGNQITFNFVNGCVITKEFSNGTGGNKKGWKERRKAQ